MRRPDRFRIATRTTFGYRVIEGMRDVGVLPWTVERHYKLLVAAWSDAQWDAVFFESAMLSYYVANTHAPFRATAER